MTIDIGFIKGMMDDFSKGKAKGKYTKRFKWKPGPNRIRIMPFEHKINYFDIERGLCSDDYLGTVQTFVAVPLIRYFLGPEHDNAMVNGLTRGSSCPMWRAYWAKSTEERKRTMYGSPSESFVVQLIDTDEPEAGVQIANISKADWLGPASRSCYGLSQMIVGYQAPPEGAEEESPIRRALPDFEGYGEEVLGAGGSDLIIYKHHKTIGKSKRLVLDESQVNGAIKKRKEGNALIPEGLVAEVVDLLHRPDCFPGYHSRGNHLTTMALNFVEASASNNWPYAATYEPVGVPTGPNGGPSLEEGTPMPKEPETSTPPQNAPTPEEQTAAQAKAAMDKAAASITTGAMPPGTAPEVIKDVHKDGFTTTRRRKPAVGDFVVAKDTTDSTVYIGQVTRITSDATGIPTAYLHMLENLQVDKKAATEVREMAENGKDTFTFPFASLTIRKPSN